MYKGVFFDIDNTLLLKKPSIAEAVFSIAAKRGGHAVPFEEVEKAYAASELWQARQIMEENRTGARMADDEYLRHVAACYQDIVPTDDAFLADMASVMGRSHNGVYQLQEGAMDVLGFLKEKGVALGVVSNNNAEKRAVLERMGLAGFFQTVILSEEVGVYKPDPGILELACREVGLQPAQCLYVGDHPFDVLCAHRAKMHAAWLPVNPYFQIPDFIDRPEYPLQALSGLKRIFEQPICP